MAGGSEMALFLSLLLPSILLIPTVQGEGNLTVPCNDRQDCPQYARCDSGFSMCVCIINYEPNDALTICLDKDECETGLHFCDQATTMCVNEPGSFSCSCLDGYMPIADNERECEDIDECSMASSCAGAAYTGMCTNTVGSYTCECDTGFRNNATDNAVCEDIDECDEDPSLCTGTGYDMCTNTPGDYQCDCDMGYANFDALDMPDPKICTNVDECSTGTPCGMNSDCTDTMGSYTCSCHMGYSSLDETDCTDIDECTMYDPCGSNTICENNDGSYLCSCQKGYDGDPDVDCADIDECGLSDNCDIDATCTNTDGSFTCACNTGYAGSGIMCSDVNECSAANKPTYCDANAVCMNTDGSFTCTCGKGFEAGTGFLMAGESCVDINECSTMTHDCDDSAFCANRIGTYVCGCLPGYTGNGIDTNVDGGQGCLDIDECSEMLHDCHEFHGVCTNLNGTFSCACDAGYTGNGTTYCVDIDECLEMTDSCPDDLSTCVNTNGSYTCNCNTGYSLEGMAGNYSCTDDDECMDDPCDDRASCTNNPGSFSCECWMYLSGDGTKCTDNAECMNAADNNCDAPNANCTEETIAMDGDKGFSCSCNKGYEGDGIAMCDNVDECMTGDDNCHSKAYCTDTDGSFTCTCWEGFEGDGVMMCTAIDECDRGTDHCVEDMDGGSCTDQTPSARGEDRYSCGCQMGYTGNGAANETGCTDVNECMDGSHNCTENYDTCVNTPGSFHCICADGWNGTHPDCTDIDECVQNTHNCLPASLKGICTNVIDGGYWDCSCDVGFEGDGTTNGTGCVDTDECLLNTDNCNAENAYCVNTFGSFRCACDPGFTGDGINSCININECGDENICSMFADCIDEIGAYSCECWRGFSGNGYVCEDIDECALGIFTTMCGVNADCVNLLGSAECGCDPGYTGDPLTLCEDIDECAYGLSECDPVAICTNTIGSHTCECPDGYYGDGIHCSDDHFAGGGHFHLTDHHDTDYIHDYDYVMDYKDLPPPESPPFEYVHYHEYYCPLNDDDCGWKPDRRRQFCWKIFPHAQTNFHEAAYECMARGIKGCPARLLHANHIPAVYYSMTYEDIEYCPEMLRVDGLVDPDSSMMDPRYFTEDGEEITIPSGWSTEMGIADATNFVNGSLTVNLHEKNISGFHPISEDTLAMVCQSCVIEIPECPGVCSTCQELTTPTPEPTPTPPPPSADCENLDGDLLFSVVGGLDLYHDEMHHTWRVFDENFNWCDAQEQFSNYTHGRSLAAYFALEEPRYDFGYALEYGFWGSEAVIAGGVIMDPDTNERCVTNKVSFKLAAANSSAYQPGNWTMFDVYNNQTGTNHLGEEGDFAIVVDPMMVPRSQFSLLPLASETVSGGATLVTRIHEWFIAYGGIVNMEGTLTDTIEFRDFDLISDNRLGDELPDIERRDWQMFEFARLPQPSRTMGARVRAPFFWNSSLFSSGVLQEAHIVALVDTNPVEFATYMFNDVNRTLLDVPEYKLPDLDLDEGELAGFVQSNNYLERYFFAMDSRTRTIYTYEVGEANTWTRRENAIPAGLTARHLIAAGEDFLHNSNSPVSLLAYDPIIKMSVLKFWNPNTHMFTDQYIESIIIQDAMSDGVFEFPVKLDLPPMRGAAFGLDGSENHVLHFTGNQAFLEPELDHSYLGPRPRRSALIAPKSAQELSRGLIQTKRRAALKNIEDAMARKKAEVMNKHQVNRDSSLPA